MANENMMTSGSVADSKLKELFIEQLQDIFWAEKKLAKALATMEEAATTSQLKNAFRQHGEETREQARRLEQVFASIGEEADTKKCPAMAGIIDEANDIIDETEAGTRQRDAGLIIAAQKAEHYEIATYGGLAQLAEILGYNEAKQLLGQTLEEEKQTDALLTQLALGGINVGASREPQDS